AIYTLSLHDALPISGGNTDALILLSGSLLGGAMFGDNLSIISDTTIAVTQTMGVQMIDKFKANGVIALIASLITCVLIYINQPELHSDVVYATHHNIVVLLPYLTIIILALCRLLVLIVVALSCILAVFIALFQGIDFLTLSKVMFGGTQSTFEIALLSLLIGGLSYLIQNNKGFAVVLMLISKSRKPLTAVFSVLSMI